MIYRTGNAAFDLAVQNAELVHQNARSMATSTASSISSTSCRSRSPLVSDSGLRLIAACTSPTLP